MHMGRFLEVFDNALRECPQPTIRRGLEIRHAPDIRSDGSSSVPTAAAAADPPTPTVTPDSRHPLINPTVRAKLEAIESDARRMSWPAELLWNANFWDSPR